MSLKTWKERGSKKAQGNKIQVTVSSLQAKIIKLLSESPMTTTELVIGLYGDGENYFHMENRLKQTLHRLRKRNPELIFFTDGKYHLLSEWSVS